MPRAARASSSAASASWLLAAPQIGPALQPRDRRLVQHAARARTAPGRRTAPRAPARPGAPRRRSRCTSTSTRSRFMSATATRAPASASSRARCEPTWPTPSTTTRLPASARVAVELLEHRSHRLHHAVGGHRRRVARAAGPLEPGDPAGLRRDDLHVARRRSDVLGRDVAAAELVDRPCPWPGAAPRSAARRDRPTSTTALPPPWWSPAGGRLEAHRLGEAQRVDARRRAPTGSARSGSRRGTARARSSAPR